MNSQTFSFQEKTCPFYVGDYALHGARSLDHPELTSRDMAQGPARVPAPRADTSVGCLTSLHSRSLILEPSCHETQWHRHPGPPRPSLGVSCHSQRPFLFCAPWRHPSEFQAVSHLAFWC